jgi:hypothetical protein
MIDNFSLLLSHGLMMLVVWRLLFRRDLDKEAPPKPEEQPKGWRKGRPRNA